VEPVTRFRQVGAEELLEDGTAGDVVGLAFADEGVCEEEGRGGEGERGKEAKSASTKKRGRRGNNTVFEEVFALSYEDIREERSVSG
jgi:hypothetical protein